ncbi:LysR family transcriptional regulator [Prauserella alba]|uniref:LysR family transcriptional regulator n=1 Tax=Prauserella alba TaxID=176898 RepID=A0ABN1VDM7_9PSEU|nr:LysR family transcriptional regulator [Prauserella alba]MCP2182441.1 DNA-binding transcriptional regulator, LysR family [Prauserella alba]
MELRQLRYFTAVFAERSLSRAAERLLISQPALTRQLRQLEQELGATLFERVHTGVRPTLAGSALHEHALQTLSMADACRRVAQSAGPAREVVRVGLPPGLPPGWVQRVLAETRRRVPLAELAFTDASSTAQLRMVREGHLDIGLIHQTPPSSLQHRELFADPFGLAVRPGHALRGPAGCRLADLDGMRVLAHARDQVPAEHDRLVAAAHDLGIAPEWHFAHFSENALACALAADATAVLLTEASAARLLPEWSWLQLTDPPFLMRTWLVRHQTTRSIVMDISEVMSDTERHGPEVA